MVGSNQNHSMKSTKLTADDVPEASLGDREPEKFKMVELRVWLQCRVARGLSKLRLRLTTFNCELYRYHATRRDVGNGHLKRHILKWTKILFHCKICRSK